jgi:hypothetical protein
LDCATAQPERCAAGPENHERQQEWWAWQWTSAENLIEEIPRFAAKLGSDAGHMAKCIAGNFYLQGAIRRGPVWRGLSSIILKFNSFDVLGRQVAQSLH